MTDGLRLQGDSLPIEYPTYDWGKSPSTDYHDHDWFWPLNKRVLTVSLLNGTNEEKNIIINLINEHYNTIKMGIRFKFLQDGDSTLSDIRVAVTTSSESTDGYMATTVPRNVPTLRLQMSLSRPGGPLQKDIDRRQSKILHEFGHALGLKHAHCHPDCTINWNHQVIEKRMGWTHDEFETQVRIAKEGIFALMPYDPKSIMHYSVRKGDTHSMITCLEPNLVLSKGDKKFLMAIYPPDGSDRTLKGVTERMWKPTSVLLREGKKRRDLRSAARQDLGHSNEGETFPSITLTDSEIQDLGSFFTDSQNGHLGTAFLQTIFPQAYRLEIFSIAFFYCAFMGYVGFLLFH
ncbi:uncharacterized protein NECHADRAFT_82917 [Fusarium vanettenii 77-13-4]|uniref:Peptidase M12A domain-containing protein n=1 Tax=Fusarium vanettenii (strain ATCC MYA-4622 / CBS 123669 / FGSC 9596 / NRRL 45880 / 77-13-4) TaxID=660122 RepID=C7YX74_FUSV7|nr:uncharacterized protein NECHADRAFT_82917 [Fusarium vanettenii 77-13-4]EEU43782.1 predicted protein [Fusarium vanettenii 77-13-4]